MSPRRSIWPVAPNPVSDQSWSVVRGAVARSAISVEAGQCCDLTRGAAKKQGEPLREVQALGPGRGPEFVEHLSCNH